MYFLTDLFRYIKITVSLIGIIVSIAIGTYGIIDNMIGYIFGAAFFMLQSLLVLADASKVWKDIKEQVDRFKVENTTLHDTVFEVTKSKNELQATAEQYKLQYDKNKKLLDENKKILDENKKQLDNLTTENTTLHETVEKLRTVYQKSMELVKSLTTFGTQTNLINVELKETKDELQQHVDALNNLVNNLSADKFKVFDINKDGYITIDEWKRGLNIN